ncbi:MAG: hypothetical protein AAF518_24125, partial [Spirochaetota bacterium]
EKYFFEITKSLSMEKCKQILLKVELIENDPTLALYLITNLDITSIEMYFASLDSINEVAGFFREVLSELEEEQVREFFIKNLELYDYIMRIFQSTASMQKYYNKFTTKYKTELELVDKIMVMQDKVKRLFDLKVEREKNPQDRDVSRLMGIMYEIKDDTNLNEISKVLLHKGLLLDEVERKFVVNVLENKQLKEDIFKSFAGWQSS